MLWAVARPPAAFLFLSGAGFLKISIKFQRAFQVAGSLGS